MPHISGSRFDFTKKGIMKSVPKWPIDELVSELRSTIKYFARGEYEKYHLSMISIILRAFQCKAEDLHNIQEHLPGTVSAMSVPVFEYLKAAFKENSVAGNDKVEFYKMIHVEFPANAERKDQKRCVELWHSVLQVNHPAWRENTTSLSGLEDDRSSIMDMYRDIVTTKAVTTYRKSIHVGSLKDDKEWLYDLQRRLINEMLQMSVSAFNIEKASTSKDQDVITLSDESSGARTSMNRLEEEKEIRKLNFGSESMLQLSENAILLFKNLKSVIDKEKILETLQKNLEKERGEMKNKLQNQMKKELVKALHIMREDVELGIAEGDQMRNGQSDLFALESAEEAADAEDAGLMAVAWKESVDTLNEKIKNMQQVNKDLKAKAEKVEELKTKLSDLEKEAGKAKELETKLSDLEKEKASLASEFEKQRQRMQSQTTKAEK